MKNLNIIVADFSAGTEYLLQINNDMIFNSSCYEPIYKIRHDRHFKTISILDEEYEKLTSKDITVAKMTSDIIIYRYTKLNMDEGEE